MTRTSTALAACAAAALAAVLLAPREASASCIRITPCQAFEHADVVVQGTVIDIAEIEQAVTRVEGRQFRITSMIATIQVEKAWKGAKVGSTIQVHSDGRSSSIGYEFTQGERYIVFAHQRGGQLQTSSCSHTNTLAKAAEDLAFLDMLAGPPTGGRVYGVVSFYEQSPDERRRTEPRAVADQQMSLRGPSGVAHARTDANGRYQFDKLAPGEYELDADLPAGWNRRALPWKFTLANARSCEEYDVMTAIDGKLSGVIGGQDGLYIPNIAVEAISLDVLQQPDARPAPFNGYTDGTGRFTIQDLPPGRYIVGVNLTRAAQDYWPYPFTAYYGGSQMTMPEPVTLGKAEQIDLGRLSVTRVGAKRVVQGRLVWADGTPASGRVIIRESRPGWPGPMTRPARSPGMGQFTAELFDGVTYQIVAETPRRMTPEERAALIAKAREGAAQGGTGAPAAGRVMTSPGGGSGAFGFGASNRAMVQSNTAEVTAGPDLPIVTLTFDDRANEPPPQQQPPP